MIDERIKYWSQGWPHKNFADFLFEYLYEKTLLAPLLKADRYRLIGSAIDPFVLQDDLRQCSVAHTLTIALWGCGKRDGRPLDPELMAHCLFFGVRGPLTRDALELPPTPHSGTLPSCCLCFARRLPRAPRARCACRTSTSGP